MKRGRIGALIGLFVVVCVAVGVLVWPEPREARANPTTFTVNVDWMNILDVDDDNIWLNLTMYDGNWVKVGSSVAMTHTSRDGEISHYTSPSTYVPDGEQSIGESRFSRIIDG